MWIDAHAHLTSPELFPHLLGVLEGARQAQLQAIINVCTDPTSLELGLQLAQQYPWIYPVAATTPHDVEKEGEEVFALMAASARQGLLKAIGETGLDYHYVHSSRAIQKRFLTRYLQLALECRLPVVIHCREAFADFFEILDVEYQVAGRHAPGMLHCFTGSMREAEGIIQRGWMLSFSGIVTFKKSLELRQVVREVPLEQLLIETDAPYLAPQSRRGQRNEPAFLTETAATIAAIKEIPLPQLAEITTKNAAALFGLP